VRLKQGGLDISWARSAAAGVVREVLLLGVLGPLTDLYTRGRVLGRQHLDALQSPVLFVANHSSHMDTP
jgi:1-acyl-sn-glycerol-3-phosphate acyltransferase